MTIDVRAIVLAEVDSNLTAADMYLTDPATHFGIEVTIAVLSHVADVCLRRGDAEPDVRSMIIEVTRLTARGPGAADLAAMAFASTQLWPPPS